MLLPGSATCSRLKNSRRMKNEPALQSAKKRTQGALWYLSMGNIKKGVMQALASGALRLRDSDTFRIWSQNLHR